ncbi:MAG: LysM peptidoglycan-binding domain-containing protein [Deltaproteobacteria bacterium]|nr:LysM peptidoglycan-binding domain-containing protein [Deltaproteobacteria bacterium]
MVLLRAAVCASLWAPVQALAQRAAPVVVRVTDRVYVVRPGDSLQGIAGRLQVPPRELAARNGLNAPFSLRVGRRLRLPEGVPQEVLRTLPTRDEVSAGSDGTGTGHRPGVVTLVRQRDQAETTTNFNAAGSAPRLRLERWAQARNGAQRVMHPRLRQVLATLSDRFGGRRIVVLSGYRPHRGGRSTLQNHHALGAALDLRVEGVATRQVYEFCQTLPRVGCGYASGGNFVHVDLRAEAAHWTVTGRSGSRGDSNIPPEDDVAEVLADAAPLDP